jgi:hypothetical protein
VASGEEKLMPAARKPGGGKRQMGTSEVVRLRAENARLRKKVAFFERNSMTLFGTKGEHLVAKLSGGFKTAAKTAKFDVKIPSGARVEVKSASLNTLYANKPDGTKRWAWMRILGMGGKKPFNWLVLLGEVDDRYRGRYADPRSPYVVFLLPKRAVAKHLIASGPGPGIQLTTNPQTVGPKGRELFEKYQVTRKELTRRLGAVRRRTGKRRG